MQEVVTHYAALLKKVDLTALYVLLLKCLRFEKRAGEDFLTVTPGIRMGTDSVDDQVRMATPRLAREYGSSAIVVGRSITKAKDRLEHLSDVTAVERGAYYAMTKLQKEIAKQLIDIEAVSLQPNEPFTWAIWN